MDPKAIVVGIDGGSWNIINKFLYYLPNFKKLIENGVSGYLKSTIPPVTCPAWKSYSTGKSPEGLGIFWWAHVDFKNNKLKFFSSRDFKAKEIWDYLSEYGYKSIIINLPLTFPPKRIKGIMISGFPASDGDLYTYPPEVKSEISSKFGYRVNPSRHIEVFKDKALEEIYSIIQCRFDCLKYYLEKEDFDFAHVTVFYTDDIQHFLWNCDKCILKAYKIIDKNLGEIIKKYPKTNVIIISDHGFEEIKDSFYINNYFLKRGYLKLKKHSLKSRILRKIGKMLTGNELFSNIVIKLFTSLPRNYQIKLKRIFMPPSDKGEDEHLIDKICDLQESLCVGLKQGPIFINKEKLRKLGIDYQRFLESLIEDMMDIKHPQFGKLIKDIYVVKNNSNNSPDIILVPNEGFEIEIGLGKNKDALWKSEAMVNGGWIAHHHPLGIFIAYGPNIKRGIKIGSIDITDVAPTILALYGIYPTNMDGKVRYEILKDQGRELQPYKERIKLRQAILKLKEKVKKYEAKKD